MRAFDLLPEYRLYLAYSSAGACVGHIHYIQRNSHSGSVETPVAEFAGHIEEPTENQPRRWEVNLFIRTDIRFDTATVPAALGEFLVANSLCREPMILNVHHSKNTHFLSYGRVWLDDE